jgi:exopolysaccharide production protein ExoZ
MKAENQRIETLDWLRGLMAFSIMIYHLSYWLIKPLDASNFFGRLGIYGVSIFFILSGLSMASAYQNSFTNIRSHISFFAKRFFRILPLYWLVCGLIILTKIYSNQFHYSSQTLFLNFTALFGFIEPNNYIATGAWSIGNEMVYYAFTPFIILIFNYSKWLGNIFFLITILTGLYFSFFLLTPETDLSIQWNIYINPFNNFFFYVLGVFMYYNLKSITIHTSIAVVLLCISVIVLYVLPFEGNQIGIVTRIPRILFVMLAFSIVFSFYKMKLQLPGFIETGLVYLGLISYGVYLFHPVVYIYSQFILVRLHINPDPYIYFIFIITATICISFISYKYFELKFISLGKKWLQKKSA